MIDEDALVEAMARAMCVASDQDPDEIETVVKPVNRFSEMQMMGGLSVVVNDTMAEYRTEKLPLWKAFEDDARRQLAAHRAMIKAMEIRCKHEWVWSTPHWLSYARCEKCGEGKEMPRQWIGPDEKEQGE